jgi:hypothetical protein
MKKLLLLFLAFLLLLLASCAIEFPLLWRENHLFPETEFDMLDITKQVFNAVQTKDASAIEGMLCLSIKENTPNLSYEIQSLLSKVEGGSFELTWDGSIGSDDSVHHGKYIRRKMAPIDFTTSATEYQIFIVYEYKNDYTSENLGICELTLYGKLDESTYQRDALYKIVANEDAINQEDAAGASTEKGALG